MLLALGPPEGDLVAAAEKSCRSSVATYTVRLGWIFGRQGRSEAIDVLLQEPYCVFGAGYVPFEALTGRLDGLISQYMLIENYSAADWLSALPDCQS